MTYWCAHRPSARLVSMNRTEEAAVQLISMLKDAGLRLELWAGDGEAALYLIDDLKGHRAQVEVPVG